MVRILGERTKQLTMGAKPLLKNYKDLTGKDLSIDIWNYLESRL